jgi:hypothetical protein
MKTFAHGYALTIGLIALAASAASVSLDRQQFGRSGGDRSQSKNCSGSNRGQSNM